MTAQTGNVTQTVTTTRTAVASRAQGIDSASPVTTTDTAVGSYGAVANSTKVVTANTDPGHGSSQYYYQPFGSQYGGSGGGEFALGVNPVHQPVAYGWVTGQNKLDANKHASGTETLGLLAYPYNTVAASLANTLAEEQADEPNHSQTEG